MIFEPYDIIVVGAGHAGCEAAAAAANMGSKVLLITMDLRLFASMSCNPAMGGIAKGQIVREIDAMGGYISEHRHSVCMLVHTQNRATRSLMLSMRRGSCSHAAAEESNQLLFSYL